MRECIIEKNTQKCTCTYKPCSRKGICCECVQYHREKGQIPGCFFSADIESTYDRSIEQFIRTYKKEK